MRLPPALSSLLARTAQHAVLSNAKIEKTWPSTSLKELYPPMQRLLLSPRQDKRDSMLPCHLWCIQKNGLWGFFENKKLTRGGGGRDPALKNMSTLILQMPGEKSSR
jgi:hypothetical protein